MEWLLLKNSSTSQIVVLFGRYLVPTLMNGSSSLDLQPGGLMSQTGTRDMASNRDLTKLRITERH